MQHMITNTPCKWGVHQDHFWKWAVWNQQTVSTLLLLTDIYPHMIYTSSKLEN